MRFIYSVIELAVAIVLEILKVIVISLVAFSVVFTAFYFLVRFL